MWFVLYGPEPGNPEAINIGGPLAVEIVSNITGGLKMPKQTWWSFCRILVAKPSVTILFKLFQVFPSNILLLFVVSSTPQKIKKKKKAQVLVKLKARLWTLGLQAVLSNTALEDREKHFLLREADKLSPPAWVAGRGVACCWVGKKLWVGFLMARGTVND